MTGLFYAFFKAILSVAFRLVTRWEVVGRENVPATGPFIVVSNHIHLFDPVLLMVSLPRRVRPLMADKWGRKPILGLLLRAGGPVFIRRGEVDRKALREVFALLEQDEALGMAPEGTRSPDGTLKKGRAGVAYIALRAGAPIVPAGMSGIDKTFSCWKRLRRPAARVVFGEPFTLPNTAKKARGQELERLTDLIMYHIADLLPQEYRGVYGGPREEDKSEAD
jgi:1-acyl-sn-glycerol-3-phosphate acyltransferase